MIHFVDGSEKSYKNLLRNYKKANLTPLKSVRQDLIQQYQALPNQSESRLERALEYRPHPSYRISDKYNLKILEDFFLDSNLEPNNLKQQEKLLFDRIKVLSYRISRIKQPKNK